MHLLRQELWISLNQNEKKSIGRRKVHESAKYNLHKSTINLRFFFMHLFFLLLFTSLRSWSIKWKWDDDKQARQQKEEDQMNIVLKIYCKTIVISKLTVWDHNFLFVQYPLSTHETDTTVMRPWRAWTKRGELREAKSVRQMEKN